MEKNSENIIQAIVTVMVVIIISVVSSLIIGTFLDNSIFENVTVTGTITDESLGAVTDVANVTFSIISTYPITTCSLTSLYNASGGETLSSGNYTFTASGCKLILTSVSNYIGDSLNVSYGFSSDTNQSTFGFNTDDLRNDFGLFITGLMAFLAVIGTIVGVVWLVFYVKQLFDKQTGLQSITA